MAEPSSVKKVSVIIPVYNVEKHLRECLDSVVNQTLKTVEIFCVDDGSTDGSAAILAEYATRDGRVRVIRQENRGTFAARKRAVAETTGDYLCFVDPDDGIKPTFCETLLAAAEKGNWDIVQCGVELLEMRKRTKEQRGVSERYFNPHAPDYDGDLLRAAYLDMRIGWNLIFRLFRGDLARRAFAEMPDLFAINETDALAFFFIAKTARAFHRISERLYVYRYGDGISTRTSYTLDDYRRTLGKFDVLAAMPFKEEPAYRAMADRMLDNAFKSATARIRTDERGEAWRRLEAKVGAEAFLDYLAKRFGSDVGPMIDMLDEAKFVAPSCARPIRRIGIHYFRISRGGVQRVMLHVAATLRTLGYEVVLLLEEPPDVTAFEMPDGLRFVLVPRSLGGKATPARERMAGMAAILREEKVDLFYTHAYASPMLVWDLLACKRILRIPTVIHYHAAFTAPMHYRIALQAFALQDKILRMADRVIALSELDAAYFRTRGAVAHALPNPMPEACVQALDAPLRDGRDNEILWCGRDSWEKHPEDATGIFTLVKKEVKNVRLVMLTGRDTDPYSSFRRASIFLNTSETEGFSMVSLEALAHGVPIVSYELGNLDLYRKNPAVVQVPQGDCAKAAEAIVALLRAGDLSELREKARASVGWVRDFDHAGFWRDFLALFAKTSPVGTCLAPSAEMQARIDAEISIGKVFQDKVRQWRGSQSARRLIRRLLQLVWKTPGFLRENGWRYTLWHIAEKMGLGLKA